VSGGSAPNWAATSGRTVRVTRQRGSAVTADGVRSIR
jgi:hypothetical protein